MAAVTGQAVGTIVITAGDTLRGPSATLRDAATRAAIDLTASTVAFRMVNLQDDSIEVVDNVAANMDDDVNGQVSYDWLTADVDTAGTYAAWWIRTEGGKTERFPSGDNYIKVVISAAH